MPPVSVDIGGVDAEFIRRRIAALEIANELEPDPFISRRIQALQISLEV